MHLSEYTVFDDAAAERLSKHKGLPSLNGRTSLSDAVLLGITCDGTFGPGWTGMLSTCLFRGIHGSESMMQDVALCRALFTVWAAIRTESIRDMSL